MFMKVSVKLIDNSRSYFRKRKNQTSKSEVNNSEQFI